MKNLHARGVSKHIARALRTFAGGALLWAAAIAPGVLHAQTASITGDLSSFDVLNDSGQAAHGFEIRLEGAVMSDLYYTALGQRYGAPKIVADLTGVSIRYESKYDAASQSYTATTPQHVPGVAAFSWNDCYQAGQGYATSGCEIFGQSLFGIAQIKAISGYWLAEDPAHPGTLIRILPPAAIPFPRWTFGAPVASTVPAATAVIEAPEPPETPEVYGDAQWIKIFKSELPRELTTAELATNDPAVVPQDPTQVEVAWDILQADPSSGTNGKKRRGQKINSGPIAPTTRSVIRRYELYKYTGVYDSITHEVVCADGGLCAAPSAGELGTALSAQNSAVNVVPDVLVVNVSGIGTVTATNGIDCGKTCVNFAAAGSSVTLTAAPGNQVFAGWTGACTGTALTCVVTVNGVTTVGAAFNPPPNSTVTVVVNGSGEVRSSVGNIRCPSACTVTLPTGTAVTFSVTKGVLTGWAGACSGTALTCTVTLTGDTNVTANFAASTGGGAGGGGGGGGGGTTSTFKISISLNGNGTVTSSPLAQSYAAGTVVTLTATPKVGSPWVGWSGACTGTATTCALTMDANKSVTANFR